LINYLLEGTKLEKLIFIYNADSGRRNAILDSLHKVLQPSTYECNLCDITFGLFREKGEWKEFRDSYPVDMEFLHRDEFQSAYASKFGHRFNYPIVLAAVSNSFEVLVSTEELNALHDTTSLINLIKERVSAH
jgi:hypothetical protein